MIKLVDCTLRDGGYYTNWDFDKNLIKKYFKYINQLPIDIIEIGYRNKTKEGYLGEFFYLPQNTIKKLNKSTEKKLSIMLNAKDCNLKDLDNLLKDLNKEKTIIRIATAVEKLETTFLLAKEINKKGFQVAINIMYISKIVNNNLFFEKLKKLKLENNVFCLYLVDSYGSILPMDLEKLINKIKKVSNIELGFHGHNNLEMALINTLTAVKNKVKYIDSTILGMGRGAGNLKTELFLTYLKSQKKKNVNLKTLGKLTELFVPLKKQYEWGTNLAYMVSGSYTLPQKEVMDALKVNRYSLAGIVDSLHKEENKQNIKKLTQENSVNSCIIIGGGESIDNHLNSIKQFLRKNKKITIIHSTSKYINKFKKLSNNQLFAVAGDELTKLDKIYTHISKYILEPNFKRIKEELFDKNIFYELENINFINKYKDSPLTISLQIASNLNCKEIFLVGFDGYSELKNKKDFYLMEENQTIINSFDKPLISLTETKYKNLLQKSIYSQI
ncbi:4-hydroxy-2-oxovalerate aldolase-like protein [Malaciobacter marinus]|uniref:4-hydroxy-2-oxovalerate aldolase-like protein n=3 Tax=Malaciobacter marinus TaxID=505249 RepID=A0A347TM12_9BACT|nr:hypothetical protein [Malaciobacter marinus]AXX87640.1 4-hydroxy-2-oxovalerate aldolase-like protein [Malaciobacter marinus]